MDSMEIDRKELKRQARERMALTDPKFWVVGLAYIALTTGVSWLLSFIPVPHTQTTLLFFQLLLVLYTTVIQFGLCLWALWTYRELDPGINSLTQGFSVAGRVLIMELGIYVRVLGWYFLAAVGMGLPVVAMLLTNANSGLGMAAVMLYMCALVAILICLFLRYALAPYLLADRPDDGPYIPVRRSLWLMKGWKMQLLKLELSFIGWDILNAILSAGVIAFFLWNAGLFAPGALQNPLGWSQEFVNVVYSTPVVILSTLVTVPVSLWLLPYRAVARAGFYDNRLLAPSQGQDFPDMPPL